MRAPLKIRAPGGLTVRVGRIQAAVRRALWVAGELPTSAFLPWAYPCHAANYRAGQKWNVRRAAERFAERAGRRGREVLWRLKDEEQ